MRSGNRPARIQLELDRFRHARPTKLPASARLTLRGIDSSFSPRTVAVAQLVELQIVVLAVAGSNPVGHPILSFVLGHIRHRVWQTFDAEAKAAHFSDVRREAATLPQDQCAELADYHAKLAAEFRKSAKRQEAE